MGFLKCPMILECALYMKARQALVSLHCRWLRGSEKWSFILSHPVLNLGCRSYNPVCYPTSHELPIHMHNLLMYFYIVFCSFYMFNATKAVQLCWWMLLSSLAHFSCHTAWFSVKAAEGQTFCHSSRRRHCWGTCSTLWSLADTVEG